MESSNVFCDLCINLEEENPNIKTLELIAHSQIDGYKVCTINSRVESVLLYDKKIFRLEDKLVEIKEKIKQIKISILKNTIQKNETHLKSNEDILKETHEYAILNRATFEFKDKKDISLFNNITDLSFIDIAAVLIKNDSLLDSIINDCDIDIITIQNTERINFFSKKKNILHAIDKGVHFEFLLADFISNETQRPIFINNFTILYEITRGRNIIFSSGSSSFLLQRVPFDILIMLETLFNLNCKASKSLICENPQNVIKKGFQRKFFKKSVLINKDLNYPLTKIK